jgi:riboflavin kinase/FMN adenylyltransferase
VFVSPDGRDLPPAPARAVTVGTFDGCHQGHQALIAALQAAAAERRLPAVALTFDPRPEAFLRGMVGEPLLFSRAQKERALGELGLDGAVVLAFDAALASLTHEAFYADHLRERLNAAVIAVGYNFRFGRERLGDAAYLQRVGARDGVSVIVTDAAARDGGVTSSTRIRLTLKQDGDVAAAARLLGRPYMLEGFIERGDQLGRQLGVPTANLGGCTQLLPKLGIYAGHVWLSERDAPPLMRLPADAIPAVFSIGMRPTVTQPTPVPRLEAHLLSGTYGADALYGQRAGFYLSHRLRDEMKLPDLDALKAQMQADIALARRLL